MTTISFKEGVMAADSGVWVESVLVCRTRKIHRLKNGSLVGHCGTVDDALTAIRWLDGKEVDKVKFDDVTLLVISPKGKILRYDGPDPLTIKMTKYIAIGTGTAIALGAMYAGASAVEAIHAAIEHDSMTRGPVYSMKVDDGRT